MRWQRQARRAGSSLVGVPVGGASISSLKLNKTNRHTDGDEEGRTLPDGNARIAAVVDRPVAHRHAAAWPMLYATLLSLHLLAATLWVGGMAVMHFAVRPAAVQVLEPPQRLPFMAAALGRFFAWVSVAVPVLLVSGVWMLLLRGGFAAAHWSVHAMFAIGLLMMAVYGHIRFALFVRLRRALEAREMSQAAAALNAIRLRVALNLALGTLVFVLAVLGRAV
jgi:uncharacterized membrane protein